MAYGSSQAEATARVKALARRVLAERIEHGEPLPVEIDPLFSTSHAGMSQWPAVRLSVC